MTCDHPEASRRDLEPADAVAELVRRGYAGRLIDLVQRGAEAELCGDCDELLLLEPLDNGLSRVWVPTAKGKGLPDA